MITITDEDARQILDYLERLTPRGQADADQLDRLYSKIRYGDPA